MKNKINPASISVNTKLTRARAPLRLGLAGGGTDLSPYCDQFGGAVLNVTIDRHAYAFISDNREGKLCLTALDICKDVIVDPFEALNKETDLILHQAVYCRMVRDFLGGSPPPLTIQTTVDAPPGSGLGSSSALVVALVEAFRMHYSLPLGRNEVAQLAWRIERKDLGLAGGQQDQYASSFGGVNFIEFLGENKVIVNPLRLVPGAMEEIETSIVICFTGQSRKSHDIIIQQIKNVMELDKDTINSMHQLKLDAHEMKSAFVHGDIYLMAEILKRSWIAKKKTAVDVSNEYIAKLLNVAYDNGALAGKVSGAGGGGFMMFIVRPEHRRRLIVALKLAGGDAEPVAFTQLGSTTWITTI